MRAPARSAADFFPPSCEPAAPGSCDLGAVGAASKHCRGCDLYLRATQTVFGTGDPDARFMLVGEQPGDAEDIEGLPFVGPSGKLLDDLMVDAGLDRDRSWVTNAVKHFKWEPKGKRRMHVKPTMVEVHACRPWLDAEIAIVEPEVLVLLGATAAQSLLGRGFRITHARGEWVEREGLPRTLATWHPSAALRAPTHEDRARMRDEMRADFRKVAEALR